MLVSEVFVLSENDYFSPPYSIRFNTDVMVESSVPLGRDDTLRLFCDKESLNKYKITITVEREEK